MREPAPEGRPAGSQRRPAIGLVVEATAAGVGRHVLDLLSGLNTDRFNVFLYASFDRPDALTQRFDECLDRGITIRTMHLRRGPDLVRDLYWSWRLARWCRDDGIELLHGHSSKGGLLARLAGWRCGLPVVFTPHAFSFFMHTPGASLYRAVERCLTPFTARLVCVSPSERQQAIEAGLPASKMTVIANGIDSDAWRPPTPEERWAARRKLGLDAEAFVIGTLGRLCKQKAHSLLIRAFKPLAEQDPHATLMIWGDGELRGALERLTRELSLQERVLMPGFIADPLAAYHAMDVFALPSLWEGAPYVLMEAMACGLPVVVSNAAGNRDIVEAGVSGLVVPIGDQRALREALRGLAGDAAVRGRMGRAARERITDHYDLAHMVKETAALYEDLLRDEKHGP